MSLQPHAPGFIPEETIRVAHAAFPKGNVFMALREEIGTIYTDQDFSALYPAQGQPAISPWRLALICVMQFMEGLTDRKAADAVRSRIDWKYALGLELTDSGFDFSVLCEFRQRLIQSHTEQHLLDLLLQRCQEKEWLKAGGKQRTDATHVIAHIRMLNRLEGIGETLRAVLNEIAGIDPDWLQQWVPQDWYGRYALPVEEYHLPKGIAARQKHAEMIGRDGMQLLEKLWDETTPIHLRQIQTVEIMRLTWVHQYFVERGKVRLRPAKDLPPAGQRFDSPYDPEAHYANKRTTTWVGYKVHLTESCDENQMHLITNVLTTHAHLADVDQTEKVHKALKLKDLLPSEHIVDSAYVDSELLVTSQSRYEVTLIGPTRPNSSWQAKTPEAYDLDQFKINWNTRRVTCPQGKKSRTWKGAKDAWGNRVIVVKFSRTDCRLCQHRGLCTRSPTEARSLTLRTKKRHQALQEVRKQQNTEEWQQTYNKRAGIEGTISQGVNAFGMRRSRYLGLAKTRLQHVLTSTAINVKRIVSWLQGTPHAQTRTSRFAALATP